MVVMFCRVLIMNYEVELSRIDLKFDMSNLSAYRHSHMQKKSGCFVIFELVCRNDACFYIEIEIEYMYYT